MKSISIPTNAFNLLYNQISIQKKPSSSSSILYIFNLSPMAVLILINLIFSTITLLSNLLSRLIFNVAAYLLVLAIQGLKIPGEAFQSAMAQIGELTKTCIGYVLEVVMEVISEIVGLVFDLVKDGVFGSVAATGAAAAGLAEKMKSGFEGLTEEIPAVVEGVVEMVTTVVSDLWSNYMDAQSYVVENA